MATCERCGTEFNLASAKMRIGHRYEAGAYDDLLDGETLCFDCAWDEIGTYEAAGNDLAELMGDSWDDD